MKAATTLILATLAFALCSCGTPMTPAQQQQLATEEIYAVKDLGAAGAGYLAAGAPGAVAAGTGQFIANHLPKPVTAAKQPVSVQP